MSDRLAPPGGVERCFFSCGHRCFELVGRQLQSFVMCSSAAFWSVFFAARSLMSVSVFRPLAETLFILKEKFWTGSAADQEVCLQKSLTHC